MLVIKTIAEIKSRLTEEKKNGKKIAFVPTMGALHDGHLALVKKAQELADIVVVSIFVNKTQFNDLQDYEKYPRQNEKDLQKLKEANANYVFLPEDEEISNFSYSKKEIPAYLKNCLCGSARAGHFEGVVQIVTKLFEIIKPDVAIFGQKDFQQLTIIKNLNFNVEIFPHEIMREKSGLAMSSRNQRLSEDAKLKAANIFKILSEIKSEILKGFEIEKILSEKKKNLLEIGFDKIDYLEIRNENNLELITKFNPANSARIFIAVYLEQVRLIDNLLI